MHCGVNPSERIDGWTYMPVRHQAWEPLGKRTPYSVFLNVRISFISGKLYRLRIEMR